MKQILIITGFLLVVFALQGQEEMIKNTYMDKDNGQTTVIIKDSTSTDLDVSGDTNALLYDFVIDINANAVTTTKIALKFPLMVMRLQ